MPIGIANARSQRASQERRTSSPRRGAVLLAAMVCLIVASMVALGIVRAALGAQRQLRVSQRSVQAERLAEAGIERAAAQLRGAADYQGETWQLSAAEMGGKLPAVAVIRVEAVAGQPLQRRVIVQADYPDDQTQRARHTSDAIITLTSQPKSVGT